MSNLTEDLLFEDSDSFSIAKIDETIARSKRIVQESLAITKRSNTKPKAFHKDSSFDTNLSINDSINLNLNPSPKKNPFSDNALKNSQEKNFKKVLSDNMTLLKDLEAEDSIRQKEMKKLEDQLKNYQSSNSTEIQESLRLKKEKIQSLTERIKTHPLYRENLELRDKFQKYQEVKVEASILSEILFERKKKEEIENNYNELYKSHQENSKSLGNEVGKIREKMKARQSENYKTINFLSSKLEEKILDNQLLSDQARITPKRNTSRDYKREEASSFVCLDKKARRYSNPELEYEFLEYNKRIIQLEAQVRKYKQKYENLKKTLQKKPRRCSSIEMNKQKENLDKSKKNIKKKSVVKTNEKITKAKRKNHTPLIAPH